VLAGSDCNNRRLCEATGVKRGDTVGISRVPLSGDGFFQNLARNPALVNHRSMSPIINLIF
jgi:hypothetical protein